MSWPPKRENGRGSLWLTILPFPERVIDRCQRSTYTDTDAGVNRRVKLSLCCLAVCAALAIAGSASADPGALAVAYNINVAHSVVQQDASLTTPYALRCRVTR